MPRTKEFEREQVLEDAFYLFWRKGYSNTSMTQLLQAMDLSRSSFYASFGDKRQVFLECLELYIERSKPLIHAIRQSDDAVYAINLYTHHALNPAPRKNFFHGCLLVNTVIELRGVDDDLANMAAAQIDKVENAFCVCFKNAEQSGKLKLGSPETFARLFMSFNQGLRVSARKGTSLDALNAQVSQFTDMVLAYAA